MAAFRPVQLTIVAQENPGLGPTLVSVPATASAVVAKSDPGFHNWPNPSFELGTIPSGDLATVFHVTGKLRRGTISIDQAALLTSPSRDQCILAFIRAEKLKVTLDASNRFEVELRT